MAGEPQTIQIDPTSELARALADADEPVVLDSNGVRYRVLRVEDNIFEGYDPRRVRDALRRSAGALAGVDVTALKRALRAQRAQDSQGRPA
jgi:hypothetical protein